MTLVTLAGRSLVYYRRTHAAVAMGVAVAVTVLAGSLLVGTSVRESLHSIAGARLGAASVVVGNTSPFTESLADRLSGRLSTTVAPMLALTGAVAHESSARRAGAVNVYAVDERFFRLHRVQAAAPTRNQAWLSEDLATELGAKAGDAVVIRIPKPTDIPVDSLHGRRDEAGRSVRLSVAGTLGRADMGEFSLAPGQGPVRSAFISLERLQRDLGLEGRINTLLVADPADGAATSRALASSAAVADLGLTVTPLQQSDVLVIESTSGLIPDAVAEALTAKAAGAGLATTPILTWLANRLIAADGLVPYSLVSAIGPDAAGDTRVAQWLSTPGETPPIVLNEWTARELHAQPGTIVNLEYFKWLDSGQLVTEHASFRVAGTIAMTGLGVDRRLAPDYPGITTATSVGDWDPPFPIDLGLVRPQDEAYWRAYRTASKALIPLASGQTLWRSRHGQLTSIRVRPAAGSSATDTVAALTDTIVGAVDPVRAGFTVVDVRQQTAAASAGSTDFGAYFAYFSAFLMISALLLAALFFRLGIEQRLSQIGVLRATGFTLAQIRRLFLIEATAVITAGAIAGTLLAVGWAALMMFALRTWWIGAVGTTQLRLHIDATSLMIGAAGAAETAVIAIAWTIRSLNKATPRAQLSGSRSEIPAMRARGRWLSPLALLGAIALSALAVMQWIPAAGAFFGAGALILVAGLAAFRRRIARPWVSDGAAIQTVAGLGIRNASWRPGRSVTVAGLVGAAVFLLVSVDAFRKNAGAVDARDSSTGGFALIAESAIPIVHDLQTRDGRQAVGLTDAPGGPLSDAQVFALRLRPGDDASCLNLFQPRHPRIVGVPEALIREARFTFAGTLANDAAARANPWTLLAAPTDDGAVPAIVDATSLEYVLHAAVGDILTIDADTARPIRLHIVGSLADSVLQGEILIAENTFRSLFPDLPGYRMFLVSLPQPTPERVGAATTVLEQSLEAFGFDAEETTIRLAAFHRVENTYLSTFQALGGLGLLLGCLGVVAVVLRNVLERRRELALLGAAGFTGSDLQRLIAIEHVMVIGAGLIIGLVAAAVAVAPVVASRGGGVPWHALAWIAPVALAGFAAAVGATRSLQKMALVPSLRSE